tara:strand:+ start:183 stop:578 length:396 start_codon:yes stop_codon:yes gene_type:complete
MAHFAKLGIGNKVENIVVVSDDIATSEQAGVEFLNKLFGTNDVWKQTSYNTFGGEHSLEGTPFRKNFAGFGFVYDQTRDAFIPPRPYNSWILNEDTCRWEAPVTKPELTEEEINNNNIYEWNEKTKTWDLT